MHTHTPSTGRTLPYGLARNPAWYVQDDFLDALHAQNMESHKHLLAEVGLDTADIPAPDLCLLGVFMGSIGEILYKYNIPFYIKLEEKDRTPQPRL